jgi:hypothetical protein
VFGAMPLDERGAKLREAVLNPGEIVFTWLRYVKSCRQETTGLQQLMKTVEAVDSADVRQTPVIAADLRISERLAAIHVYLTKS